jgi:hypothetical protein
MADNKDKPKVPPVEVTQRPGKPGGGAHTESGGTGRPPPSPPGP